MNTRKVLITGASSGIGAELARQYAGISNHLILVARRKKNLLELKNKIQLINPKCEVLIYDLDITDEISFNKMVEDLKKIGPIDTVIANAGMGVTGLVESLTLKDFDKQFDINVRGVLITILPFLSQLKKTKGRICIISSVLGYMTVPKSVPYAMSKFSVRALAEGLSMEMVTHGVSVTCCSPGIVKSEFRLKDNLGNLKLDEDPVPNWIVETTENAVCAMVKAIEKRKREVVITKHGKFLVLLNRLFPKFTFWLTSQAIKRKKND